MAAAFPLTVSTTGRLLFLSCFMKSPERRRKVVSDWISLVMSSMGSSSIFWHLSRCCVPTQTTKCDRLRHKSIAGLYHQLVLINDHRLSALIHHLRVKRDDSARTLFSLCCDHFFLHMDGVADESGFGKPEAIDAVKCDHGIGGLARLHGEAARDAEHQQAMRDAFAERSLARVFLADVQFHEIAGQSGEIHDVRFRDGAGAGDAFVSDRKVLEMEAHKIVFFLPILTGDSGMSYLGDSTITYAQKSDGCGGWERGRELRAPDRRQRARRRRAGGRRGRHSTRQGAGPVRVRSGRRL